MPYVFCRLHPPRQTFPSDMTEEEGQLMAEHAAYWRRQTMQGVAIAFGPVLDPSGAWGLGLAEADDDSEILADVDPIVAADLGFRYDIHPMPSLILRDGLGPVQTDA